MKPSHVLSSILLLAASATCLLAGEVATPKEATYMIPSESVLFVDHSKNDRTGHLGHALVEYADGKVYGRILDTNLKGTFFCAQRALSGMKEGGWGRVLNISSVHEFKPFGVCVPYSMTKAGLAMMTRERAQEFSPFGITVNCIAPGAIRTDINREVLADPAYEAKVLAKIPAGFIGETADVASLVAFLASAHARYITGASIFVDGGMVL
jgi:NAD(P)-dependent dehydrogenase (short-subunit alcohol dehydrogenase family)